ncbi:hypothetical protein C8F04DRAFT_1179674 [Mycena alexandri]|uniref:Uncharacterized protein n=1 Tax=Mycena alexandri TaxID=1745969 RepID=A0AAD6X460_9AGAR|nr:hypothetical protein C8F04DRAFT_1182554 [Mycena alexandri]KAJ7038363.1 hypothetical protein C8F04DRAFT_1179674 [Mycena alexandri]
MQPRPTFAAICISALMFSPRCHYTRKGPVLTEISLVKVVSSRCERKLDQRGKRTFGNGGVAVFTWVSDSRASAKDSPDLGHFIIKRKNANLVPTAVLRQSFRIEQNLDF